MVVRAYQMGDRRTTTRNIADRDNYIHDDNGQQVHVQSRYICYIDVEGEDVLSQEQIGHRKGYLHEKCVQEANKRG
jgi:hypothetical protein